MMSYRKNCFCYCPPNICYSNDFEAQDQTNSVCRQIFVKAGVLIENLKSNGCSSSCSVHIKHSFPHKSVVNSSRHDDDYYLFTLTGFSAQ